MKFYIIIPAHNEEKTIGTTINSLVNQTILPKKLVVVNDNSVDNTGTIVSSYCKRYKWIKKINSTSSSEHLPGSKIINAFYKGYEALDEDYDIICKFDADLAFNSNYLEKIEKHFKSNHKLGLVGGVCVIKKEQTWVPEGRARGDHIRGALKAYRKECFVEIGKIKKSIGWDTIDEFLAQYYSWEILTDTSLKVKHLRATGHGYSPGAEQLQGVATYRTRLGIILTLIVAIKAAIKAKRFLLIKRFLSGYFMAKTKKLSFLVDKDQGKFIRAKRWGGILKRLFLI